HCAQWNTAFWGGVSMAKDLTICVGTIGSGIWRSPDGGETWTRVRPSRYPENDVRALAVHPRAPHIVYAGTDAGVYRSEDRGATWTTIAGGLSDPDIHGIAISGGQPKVVLATTPREVFASTDTGESWQRLEVMQQFPHAYTRAIAVKADDPHVLFVGHGQTASPTIGSVQRSQDGGKTWATLPLPGEPNSYISCLATHPSDPNLVLASTLYGQLLMSHDAGDAWRKVRQEFSEVRALA